MSENIIMPGEILGNARQSANLTVEEVAGRLNLTAFVIRAIESGRYEVLHGDAFVCGVLRAYADLLDIDSLPLVRSYRESRSAEPEAIICPGTRLWSISDQHRNFGTGYGVAVVLMLVIVVSFFWGRDNVREDLVREDSIAIDIAAGTAVIDSMDEMPVVNPTQDLLPEMVQVSAIQHEYEISTENRQNGPLGSSSQREWSATAGLSLLSFTFSADCWVEVSDGDGRQIFASMQRAQQRLELSGKPPFRITLGYAPGVALSYNSQPVVIDSGTSHVARLVLGNS